MKSLNGEIEYLKLVKTILDEGTLIPNRTGIAALTVPHMMLQHNMSLGFPLMTTKKMAWKAIKVELEGFIKGITDKSWFQQRGCHIWDEWCNPKKVPANISNDARKQFQLQEKDLGPIYGSTWRNFNNQNIDQLKIIVDRLKVNPYDRRMLCTAWNPAVLDEQALPPCHYSWYVTVTNKTLHLCWTQRSCDFLLGIPFNIASYALLLHLLCKETGFIPGIVTGFLANCHIYENHIEGAKIQLEREPLSLPTIETEPFTSIYEWEYSHTKLLDYKSYDRIPFDIAI